MHPSIDDYRQRVARWVKRGRLKAHRYLPGMVGRSVIPKANLRFFSAGKDVLERFNGLGGFTHDIEEQFVKIGNSLEQTATTSRTLIRESEEMVAFVIGANGGEQHLNETLKVLESPMGFIDDCLAKSSRLVTRLRHHEAQLNAVRGLEASLNNTIAPLRFIQTLFKVESACLPDSVQSIFVGLTKDIEQLHQKVAEIFSEHFLSLARSHNVILGLIERLEGHVSKHAAAVNDKKRLIQSSIDTLQHDMADNSQRDVRLATASRAISEQASRIVSSIQFQDITRQKLEHIGAAIISLRERILSLSADGVDYESPEAQGNLYYIKESCSLQATHLLTVLEDLTSAETDVRDAMQSLRDRTQELDSECVSLKHFKSVSAAEDGMVQILLDIVASVRVLVSETLQMQEEIYETIRPLGGLASNLTSTMRSISSNIKLIALNAQIQAAHTGEGTGLEVLAEATCRISDETYQFNENTAADLDAFIWGLENIITECKAVCDAGRGQVTLLDSDGKAAESILHAYRDATIGAMLQVGQTTEAIAVHCDEGIAECCFKRIATKHVEALFASLHELFESCDALLLGPPSEEQLRQTEHLKPNYTMASERAVHSAMDEGRAGILEASAKEGVFEAFSEEATIDPSLCFPQMPDLDEVVAKRRQQKEHMEKHAEAAISKPESKEDLGDNVELF
ncbi:MAG: hypothetical protein SFV32_05345 [Opitutaceae bacterium]|nr:hypothetical protein [Opitutaceae bacterium]